MFRRRLSLSGRAGRPARRDAGENQQRQSRSGFARRRLGRDFEIGRGCFYGASDNGSKSTRRISAALARRRHARLHGGPRKNDRRGSDLRSDPESRARKPG